VRALYFSCHSGNMTEGEVAYSDSGPGNWTPVPPGAIGETLPAGIHPDISVFEHAIQRFRCRPVKAGASQFTGFYFSLFQNWSCALCTAAHHCSLLMSFLT
jgi:hypothetical protein